MREEAEGMGLKLNSARVFLLVILSTLSSSSDFQSQSSLDQSAQAILDRDCMTCHGGAQMSGLDLRKKEAILKGGKRGPAVIPGKAAESLLYQAASHSGQLRMPPGKEPLSPADLKVLREWITQTALWVPSAPAKPLFTEAQKAFWSFQSIKDPKPPVVKDSNWPKSSLDRFILAKLEEKGLSPAPQLDKRRLIRRVTFDLTGLPPTPEELDRFLADESPKAFEALVDRLLASPHYGEHWGRHWLDLVRYADTTANDGNYVMRYAYRYRDYVVRAFNRDLPYDQFIVEQLAGDLLPVTKNLDLATQRAIATGFLMLGPKALAEQDKEKLVLDVIDEQIDVTSKAFLGLTVACARCHDHKFDPIPTRDYYSIAGIFKSTNTMTDRKFISMWSEYKLLEVPGEKPLVIMAPNDGAPTNLRIHVRGNYHNLGEEAPRGFLHIIEGKNQPSIGPAQSGRLELARWIANSENPLTARVMVNRIWQGHFGTGLVSTSDNFGATGEKPSHPELLDWLASRFIESGWSIKSMHRLMLLSSTYQMQSTPSGQALKLDPDNRLKSHMPRRRLSAEQLRDAILEISGQLDRAVGGSVLDLLQKDAIGIEVHEMREFFSAAKGGQGFASYNSLRRSIYLPVVRNQLLGMLQVFDFADANAVTPARNDTTVPLQALFLMNNPFTREQSLQFARRLIDGICNNSLFKQIYRLGLADAKDEDRLRMAHVEVLGRPPRNDEIAQAEIFLRDYGQRANAAGRSHEDSRLAAWQSYCQTLFCLNEFLYVD